MRAASLAAFAFAVALAPATAQTSPASSSAVAPADEYFGRLKMSILGIANTIKDMKARIEVDATRTPSIFGALDNVEDAIHDWERHYPRDSWIAKDLYALLVVYGEANDARAPALAARADRWLEADYPHSDWAAKAHVLIVQLAAKATPAAMANTASASPAPPSVP